MTELSAAGAGALLSLVRERRPLVHHITNVVTVNDVANATLAIGAAPVMAIAPEEVEEMVASAGALALNIGTLTSATIDVMLKAGRRANTSGIPVVLDPVGAGATAFRTAQSLRLLAELRLSCVRGNAGEIAALAGQAGGVRGVEATGRVEAHLAKALSGRTGAVVAATGPVDVLSDGTRVVRIENGHPMLARITGSGCMATALIAAFAAVEADAFVAAGSGLLCFEIAAECAVEAAHGPGTFRTALIDALAGLDAPTVLARARLRA